MFPILKRKHSKPGLVSIVIFPDGVSFAYCSAPNHTPPKIDAAQFYSFQQYNILDKCLSHFIKEHQLHHIDCNWVLHSDDYQLILIDKPKTQPEEYRLAVRWQIKDSITIPMNDLLIDIFDPPPTVLAHKNKLYAVATQQSYIQEIIESIKASSLNLISIDIPELSLRNLISALYQNNKPIACLHASENSSLFLFISEESIEFGRSLRYGLETLKDTNYTDHFISDLQRSLDYYQTRLKRPAPEKIILLPSKTEDKTRFQPIIDAFKNKIEWLDLNTSLTLNKPLSDTCQAQCTIAIGGALRKESGKS